MSRPVLLSIIVLAAAAATVVIAYGMALFGGGQKLTPEQLALGQRIYEESCAACHGANLEGEANWRARRADGTLPAPPHDETGHTWHHPDSQLFAITKQGTAAFAPEGYKTNMAGFGEVLSDDEIRAVLEYIRSRWPEEIRRRQDEMNRRAG